MYHFKRLRPGGGHLEGPGEPGRGDLGAGASRRHGPGLSQGLRAGGGAASGEHGIGVSKRRYFLRETRRENLTVMNQIKDVLYPPHILNGQKSYIGGHDYAEPV